MDQKEDNSFRNSDTKEPLSPKFPVEIKEKD